MTNARPILRYCKKTTVTRDRYVDFLRALSILIVVIGHWLSAVVIRNEYGVRVYNAVGMISGLWIIIRSHLNTFC